MSQPQLPQSADEIWPWIVGQFPPEVQPYVNFGAAILVSLLVVFGLIKPLWDALAKRGTQPVPTTGNPHLDALLQLEARGKLDAEERRRLKDTLFIHVSTAAPPQGDGKAEAREAFDRAVDTVLDQEKPKEAAAQLAEFAKDPIGTIDALLAQAKTAADFREAGGLAFPIDTTRALRAYQQARALDASDLESLNKLGWLHFRLGDNAAALEAWSELAHAGEGRDVDALCKGLNGLGHIAHREGDLDGATRHYQRGLDAARAMSAREREAAALTNLGNIAQTRGDHDAAESHHNEALTINRQLGRKEGEAIALSNLGIIARIRGDLDTAESHQHNALALNRQLGRKEGEAITLGNLGNIAKLRGDLDAAELYQRESLALNRQLGRKDGEAGALSNLGNIALTRGDLDTAERHFWDARAIHQQLSRKEGEAITLINLSNIAQVRGDLDAAENHLQESLALYRELGGKAGEATALGNLGLITHRRGNDPDAAERYQRDALALNRQLGDKEGEAITLSNLGNIAYGRDKLEDARTHWRDALELFEAIGAGRGEGAQIARNNLARIEST